MVLSSKYVAKVAYTMVTDFYALLTGWFYETLPSAGSSSDAHPWVLTFRLTFLLSEDSYMKGFMLYCIKITLLFTPMFMAKKCTVHLRFIHTTPCSSKAHFVIARSPGSIHTSSRILTSLSWLSSSHPIKSCSTMWILRMWSPTRMTRS